MLSNLVTRSLKPRSCAMLLKPRRPRSARGWGTAPSLQTAQPGKGLGSKWEVQSSAGGDNLPVVMLAAGSLHMSCCTQAVLLLLSFLPLAGDAE